MSATATKSLPSYLHAPHGNHPPLRLVRIHPRHDKRIYAHSPNPLTGYKYCTHRCKPVFPQLLLQ